MGVILVFVGVIWVAFTLYAWHEWRFYRSEMSKYRQLWMQEKLRRENLEATNKNTRVAIHLAAMGEWAPAMIVYNRIDAESNAGVRDTMLYVAGNEATRNSLRHAFQRKELPQIQKN